MVADQLYRTVPVCLSHWYYSVGLGGTGRACHESEYDFCIAPAGAQSHGCRVYDFYSIGSAAGSIASTHIYAQYGWHGVCVLGASVSAVALIFWAVTKGDKGAH